MAPELALKKTPDESHIGFQGRPHIVRLEKINPFSFTSAPAGTSEERDIACGAPVKDRFNREVKHSPFILERGGYNG